MLREGLGFRLRSRDGLATFLGGQPGTAHSPGLGGDWGPELGIGPKQQQALKRPQDTRPQELQGGLHETASMSKPVGGRAHAHTCS